jgi:hypothetical protein
VDEVLALDDRVIGLPPVGGVGVAGLVAGRDNVPRRQVGVPVVLGPFDAAEDRREAPPGAVAGEQAVGLDRVEHVELVLAILAGQAGRLLGDQVDRLVPGDALELVLAAPGLVRVVRTPALPDERVLDPGGLERSAVNRQPLHAPSRVPVRADARVLVPARTHTGLLVVVDLLGADGDPVLQVEIERTGLRAVRVADGPVHLVVGIEVVVDRFPVPVGIRLEWVFDLRYGFDSVRRGPAPGGQRPDRSGTGEFREISTREGHPTPPPQRSGGRPPFSQVWPAVQPVGDAAVAGTVIRYQPNRERPTTSVPPNIFETGWGTTGRTDFVEPTSDERVRRFCHPAGDRTWS